jgi:hypothetical protein
VPDDKPLVPKLPKWPPAWNPFEVFLLTLSLASSVGLLQGNTGSTVLDAHLNDLVVTLWGVALAAGSLLALAGVYCYRREATLMPGLVLERAGLTLVGVAAAIYSAVVLSAVSFSGARWPVSIQVAYAAACFFRAWQDHRAIGRTYRIIRRTSDRPRGR